MAADSAPWRSHERYRGLLQSDGYDAYGRHAQREDLVWIGCWAHARRQFVEALKNHRREAGLVLSLIGRLYGHERRYREETLTPEQRQGRRIEDQTNTIRHLRRVLGILAPGALPKSDLGKACNYTLGHWPQLVQYLQYGQVEIDNNLIENAIRPSALGKKNWLFIGHPNAGERSAIIYSILISCQRLDLRSDNRTKSSPLIDSPS